MNVLPTNGVSSPTGHSIPWQTDFDKDEAVRQLLKHGTPDWVSHPRLWLGFAKEVAAAERETSEQIARQYHMENQSHFLMEGPRKVNRMLTRNFVTKLQNSGVKCFVIDNAYKDTVGLWAVPDGKNLPPVAVCYLQAPVMYEWSVLKLDKHGSPAGEKYRGWRTAVSQLILKDIISEDKAHEIFGRPTESLVSQVYRSTLYYKRNNR